MYYSLVIELYTNTAIYLPVYTGYFAYGIVLDLIRKFDAPLADKLHQDRGVKPFTVSNLWGNFDKEDKAVILQPERQYYLKLTFLQPELFNAVLQSLSQDELTTLSWGEKTLQIKQIALNRLQHPQAHFITGEKLWRQAKKDYLLALNFLSPTVFKQGQINYILPESKKVFTSLWRKWQKFGTEQILPDMDDKFINKIFVRRYQHLQTRMINLKNSLQVGFTGQVWFEIETQASAIEIKKFNFLADWAELAGVGAKTTLGFGQCRRQNAY